MSDRYERISGTWSTAITFFLFFLVVIVLAAVGFVYATRDQWILQYVKREGARQLGLAKLEVEDIVTNPVGGVSIEIHGLNLQTNPSPASSAKFLTSKKIVLSTPKNLIQLYLATLNRGTIPVKAQILSPSFDMSSAALTEGSKTETPTAEAINTAALSPLPVNLDFEMEIREGRLLAGSPNSKISLQGITGVIKAQAPHLTEGEVGFDSQGTISLRAAMADRSFFPFRLLWTTKSERSKNGGIDLQLTSSKIEALGVALNTKGSLNWPSQDFQIEAAGSSSDLGTLPLEKSESEALGLSGRLEGAIDLTVQAKGNLTKSALLSGIFKAKAVTLPFLLNRETPRPTSIVGPVRLDAEVPFDLDYNIAAGKFTSIDLPTGSFRADLSAAEIKIAGILKKPPATLLTLSAQLISQGENFSLEQLQLGLANLNLTAKGRFSLDPRRPSQLELVASLPSLLGWPKLLPVLGTFDASPVSKLDMNQANGSLLIRAQATGLLKPDAGSTPDLIVKFDQLELGKFDFPINLNWDPLKRSVKGVLHGNLSFAGQLSPTEWSVQRATGQFNFNDLAIEWDDTLSIPSGNNLRLSINAKGDEHAVQIESFEVVSPDVLAAVKAKISRHELKNGTVPGSGSGPGIDINSASAFKGSLAAIYNWLPALRKMKSMIPRGLLQSDLKMIGSFYPKEGLAKAPLAVTGTIKLKAPQLDILDPKKAMNSAHEKDKAISEKNGKEDLLAALGWPVYQKSKIQFDYEIESLTYGSTHLKAVNGKTHLENGTLKGSAQIGSLFGGVFQLQSFEAKSSSKNTEALEATAKGVFGNVDLSAVADFVDPSYKSLVGGKATGRFELNALPFSTKSFIETTSATGALKVTNGFLSTVSLDQLVNEKLSKIPGIGNSKTTPTIATKGVRADMISAFVFNEKTNDQTLKLKQLGILTPEKNELSLTGTIKTNMVANLSGNAYLTNAPVGGSFREANSDSKGRLVVPIKIDGPLKEPNLTIAEEAISAMTKRTIELETKKVKKAISKKTEKFVEEKKKEAIDAVKEELKKRGLSF